jgi:hypothetical protein
MRSKLTLIAVAVLLAGCSVNIGEWVFIRAQQECEPYGGLAEVNTVMGYTATCRGGHRVPLHRPTWQGR